MYIVYGIPNCDTVKKVFTWLQAHKIPYQFHDYKKEGITPAQLKKWSEQVGWEILLNKKSTTWRELDATTQASILNEKAAVQLMAKHTSIIKRPVIEKNGEVMAVGFNETAYQNIFQ
jgi:Spx/MgsR family transcriptional regulator